MKANFFQIVGGIAPELFGVGSGCQAIVIGAAGWERNAELKPSDERGGNQENDVTTKKEMRAKNLVNLLYVAYLLVHNLAILSCSSLFCVYCEAMLPTRGSAENSGKSAQSKVEIYGRS